MAITLYRKKEIVKNGIPQENGVDELISLLKQDGVWTEPTEQPRKLTPIKIR
jgi:(E)-4-hydroxy-3-methylbut-2-enyl-diphosphate synthase